EAAEAIKKTYGDKIAEIDDAKNPFASFGMQRSVIQDWFALVPSKVIQQGQVWRLITHAFCHDRYGLWHILLNMLALYWFGVTLEIMFGRREFAVFYFAGILAAAFTNIALDLYLGNDTPAIGASGAVMAVMMLYTWHFPHSVLYVCWVIPMEMWMIMSI